MPTNMLIMCFFSSTTHTGEHNCLWLKWILIYIEFCFGLCQEINVNCWIYTHQHNSFHLHQAHTLHNTDRRRTQVCSHKSAHRHVSPRHIGPELQHIIAWVCNSLTFYNAQVDYRSKLITGSYRELFRDELILTQVLPMFCQTVKANRISHSKLRHSFLQLKADC